MAMKMIMPSTTVMTTHPTPTPPELVLIASAFTMRHTRFGNTGIAVLASVLIGFALYFVRNFAQILGESGQISVLLAAWAPPVASVMLALGLLLHMEDG